MVDAALAGRAPARAARNAAPRARHATPGRALDEAAFVALLVHPEGGAAEGGGVPAHTRRPESRQLLQAVFRAVSRSGQHVDEADVIVAQAQARRDPTALGYRVLTQLASGAHGGPNAAVHLPALTAAAAGALALALPGACLTMQRGTHTPLRVTWARV